MNDLVEVFRSSWGVMQHTAAIVAAVGAGGALTYARASWLRISAAPRSRS